jgi:hypothetical protein
MPLLNTANKVMLGTQPASKVYLGPTQVWSSALNPKSIPGLTVWLDASTLPLGPVSPWTDMSGLAHHGTIVGSPAPTVVAGLTSKVVRFIHDQGRVRGNNGLASGIPSYNFTMCYVTHMGPANSVGRVFTATYPPTNYLVGFHTSGYECMYDNGWVNPGVGWPAPPTPWKIYGSDASHDGTNYLSRFFINGVGSGTSTGGTGMGQTYNLSGYDATGTQETCDCEVAELLIYSRKLLDAERVQVENYLRTKWGLS